MWLLMYKPSDWYSVGRVGQYLPNLVPTVLSVNTVVSMWVVVPEDSRSRHLRGHTELTKLPVMYVMMAPSRARLSFQFFSQATKAKSVTDILCTRLRSANTAPLVITQLLCGFCRLHVHLYGYVVYIDHTHVQCTAMHAYTEHNNVCKQ